MSQPISEELSKVLGRIPKSLYVLTASDEERRRGLLISRVQQVSNDPATICVAVPKGEIIMPLISESRHFGVCQLSPDNRMLLRKFQSPANEMEDVFLGHELVPCVPRGVPILALSLSYLTCELISHMDVEGDHDLLVGQIMAAQVLKEGTPVVDIGEDSHT